MPTTNLLDPSVRWLPQHSSIGEGSLLEYLVHSDGDLSVFEIFEESEALYS
jgi:hypothetical protein